MSDPKLNILFLAKHAPEESSMRPEINSSDGITPIYHYEIFQSLKKTGHNISSSNSVEVLFDSDIQCDYVFSLYNKLAFRNSEVFVSALCEHRKIPYLGAKPNIRAIAEDKHLAKVLASYLGIKTPQWKTYRVGEVTLDPPEFAGPYFIKPRTASSSVYINEDSIAENWDDVVHKIKKLHQVKHDALVEKFIPGVNLTLPIIADEIYPVIEGTSALKGNIMSYDQKKIIAGGLSREILQDVKLSNLLADAAMKIYEQSRPIDYARFDFRIDETDGEPYFLEYNISCNLGTHSSIVMAAQSKGFTQFDVVSKILHYSLNRQNLLRY